MSRFKEILENVILNKKENRFYNRLYVVSAYGGVTNKLLEHKKTGAQGIYAKFVSQRGVRKAIKGLIAHLKSINHDLEKIGLDLKEADEFIENRIEKSFAYLESMAHALSSGYVREKSILLAGREMLASIGETHAAFNSANIVNHNGYHATFIDLSGFNDSHLLTIDERIEKSLEGIDFSQTICFITGYTKGVEGIMREFDRGYSEVTFSKVACALKADEAVIHKEFHLSSADPALVGEKKAVVVGNTNFDVADQLADVGMEAIHPKAAKPLERLGIPLRLKNAFDWHHPGTLITKDYIGPDSKVEIITGSDKVALIEVHDPQMVGAAGFDYELMRIFYEFHISYILKATNANSISHLVWEKNKSDAFIRRLEKTYQQVKCKDVAIVCAIGSNIAKPGILQKATHALGNAAINIICISQSMRQVNMQFVIERKDFEKAIKALNQDLCVKN